MIIGIDYRIANSSNRGMARYTKEIVSCLTAEDTGNTYILYVDRELKSSIGYSENTVIRKINKSRNIIGEQIYLALWSYIDRLDILWSPYNTFPLFTNPKTRIFVTIHDLVFFYRGGGRFSLSGEIMRLYKKYCLILGKKRITHFFTVSEYSMNEIRKKLSIDNISITSNCIDNFYDKVSAYKRNHTPHGQNREPFFFTVSGDTWSKNLPFVINFFKKHLPETRLYIAGVPENSYLHGLTSDFVIILNNNVKIDELIEYYLNCKAFLFLSLQEGFGIPVLEAIVCGAKIIASNRTSIPEVAGNCAILIDPNSKEQFKKAISDIETFYIDEEHKQKHLAKYLSWKTSAKFVYDAFCQVDKNGNL